MPKVKTNKPLLYIQQPEFEPVITGNQVVEVKALSENEAAQENPEEEQAQEQTTESDNVIKNGVSKKVFASKTIDEKILFLTELPNNMPPVTCEFKTSEKVYRGVLLSCEEGLVTIRSTSKGNVRLQKDHIKEISPV